MQRRGRLLVHLEKRANSCDRVADNPILLQLSKHTANRQLYKHTAIQTHTQTNTDTHIYRYVCTVLSGSVHKVVQHSKAQHSTVQYSTVQCGTMWYSVVQYSTVQYGTVRFSAIPCSTVQYSTMQYSTVQCDSVQYSAVQCSTVQSNAVQYSTVQSSPVQYSPLLFCPQVNLDIFFVSPVHMICWQATATDTVAIPATFAATVTATAMATATAAAVMPYLAPGQPNITLSCSFD